MNNESSENKSIEAGPIRPATSCEITVAEIADRYEVIHQRGEQPNLDEHIDLLPSHCHTHRKELLNLLLLTDAHYWPFRLNRDVSKQDLLENYPHHADLIQQTAIARELDTGCELRWRLGKFELAGRFFEGKQGKVYRATDRNLDRTVALKIAHPHWSKDWLNREGRVLANIHHPNILRVHELAYVNDEPILVMDYIESASLRHRFADSSLSEEQIVNIGIQLSEAVNCLHDHDLCHRDIKPENILYSRQGIVTLIDFGLAIKFDRLSNPDEVCQSFDGTPAFMAPEQARHDTDIDPRRSDLYAIGATLLWLMTKQPPVVGETVDEVLANLHDGNLNEEAFAQARANYPDTCDVVIGLLAVDPAERPANAESVLASLQKIEQAQIAASSPSLKKNRFLQFVGTGVIVAVVAGIWITSGPNPQNQKKGDQTSSVSTNADDDQVTDTSPKASITGPLGSKFVLIPAGQFEMGASAEDEYADEDEFPQHSVEITQDFYLSQTEVTVGQFRKFIDATGHQTRAEKFIEETKGVSKIFLAVCGW